MTHPAIVLADELIAAREKATPGEWVLNRHQGAGNLFRLDNEMSANEFCITAPANLPFVRLSANNSAKLAEMLKVAVEALKRNSAPTHGRDLCNSDEENNKILADHFFAQQALSRAALARIAEIAEWK